MARNKISDFEDFNGSFNSGCNIFAVLHFNNGKEKEAFDLISKRSFDFLRGAGFIAEIIHDRDTEENGEVKTPHIHLVLESEIKQSKQNWITALADAFGLELEAVGVRSLASRRGAVRYLTHIDHPEKYQYSRDLCWFSNETAFLACFEPVLVENPPIEDIIACNGPRALYALVGGKSYNRFKQIRADVLQELEIKESDFSVVSVLIKSLGELVSKAKHEMKKIDPNEIISFLSERVLKMKDYFDADQVLYLNGLIRNMNDDF